MMVFLRRLHLDAWFLMLLVACPAISLVWEMIHGQVESLGVGVLFVPMLLLAVLPFALFGFLKWVGRPK